MPADGSPTAKCCLALVLQVVTRPDGRDGPSQNGEMMLESVWNGLLLTLHWKPLCMILLAVPIGMFFGAVPGLGGKLCIALFIPFVFGMEAVPGFAFLLGMHSVVHTGGALPSILFGTPGTGPDAATIVDGFPMAKRGEAGRAMGAALGASGLGGLIGAVMMAVMIPVVRPVVLAFSPSEFFMMAIFGITLIALVSGRSLLKGLIVGAFGLGISMVGMDPQTGTVRFADNMLFLWDGVDLITLVVGVFALAEMIELGVKGGSIAQQGAENTGAGYTFSGVIEGIRDVFRHWWLFCRCSIIGYVIGMIPGLGGDAASWICYGHAVQSSKDPESFGKGNVAGVIAPEAANNSKEGGALIPTVAFGVPGSSGMAILLGAFLILGLTPGPMVLINDLDTVWAMCWILAIANVVAVIMFLGVTGWVAKLTFIRGSLIIPFVFVLVMLGSFLAMRRWENLILAVGFGIIGYAMKKCKYPRPPLVIGVVLGGMAEVNLHKSLDLWGIGFLTRPLTAVLLGLTILSVLYPLYKRLRGKTQHEVAVT
jgi:putative tricarboxylic transport membrane protein